MRETDYRAWDKINKRMFTPISIHHPRYLDSVEGATGQSSSDVFSLKRKDVVLMQYTGLKDKNDIKIYEGDVVEKEDMRFIVAYYKGRFFAKIIKGLESEGYWEFGLNSKLFKIIDNIYKNTELIK